MSIIVRTVVIVWLLQTGLMQRNADRVASKSMMKKRTVGGAARVGVSPGVSHAFNKPRE